MLVAISTSTLQPFLGLLETEFHGIAPLAIPINLQSKIVHISHQHFNA